MNNNTRVNNILICSLLIISVMCSSTYWFCNTNYPKDSPIAWFIIQTPILNEIMTIFSNPIASLLSSITALGLFIYEILKAVSLTIERKSKISYWVFGVFAYLVHIYHVITFFSTLVKG